MGKTKGQYGFPGWAIDALKETMVEGEKATTIISFEHLHEDDQGRLHHDAWLVEKRGGDVHVVEKAHVYDRESWGPWEEK